MAELVAAREKKGFAVMVGYPEFLKLFIGQTVSRLGDSIDALAVMWMAYKLTDSPTIMATVMVFNALPSLLFGVSAGVFIDRWDRKKVLIAGDLGRGAVVALTAYLYFSGQMVYWFLFAATFLISTIEVFSAPARSAVVPALVDRKHLMTANSMFNLSSSICEIVGVGMASAIVATWGIAAAILIDALSFWFCAMMTFITRIPKLPTNEKRLDFGQYISELREGFQFIRGTQVVFISILMAAFTNFSLAPVGVVFPIFSDRVLDAGATGFALMSACFSTGVLVGSVLTGQFGDRMKRKSVFVRLGISGLGIAFGILGFAREPLMAGVICFLAGLSLPWASVSFNALIQQHTPDEKLGRVSAFTRTLALAGMPLGLMLTGVLVEFVPPNYFFHITGILVLVVVSVTSLSSEFRQA